MAKATQKTEEKNILTVKIKVKDRIEAYAIVSELGFDYEILSADLDGYKETFNKENKPAQFLRDNKNNKKTFRDIRAERIDQ